MAVPAVDLTGSYGHIAEIAPCFIYEMGFSLEQAGFVEKAMASTSTKSMVKDHGDART